MIENPIIIVGIFCCILVLFLSSIMAGWWYKRSKELEKTKQCNTLLTTNDYINCALNNKLIESNGNIDIFLDLLKKGQLFKTVDPNYTNIFKEEEKINKEQIMVYESKDLSRGSIIITTNPFTAKKQAKDKQFRLTNGIIYKNKYNHLILSVPMVLDFTKQKMANNIYELNNILQKYKNALEKCRNINPNNEQERLNISDTCILIPKISGLIQTFERTILRHFPENEAKKYYENVKNKINKKKDITYFEFAMYTGYLKKYSKLQMISGLSLN